VEKLIAPHAIGGKLRTDSTSLMFDRQYIV
jgi:hypothetical protein